jgi:pyruvate kinase
VDLQGPEIRIETPSGSDVALKRGDTVLFVKDFDQSRSHIDTVQGVIRIKQYPVFSAIKTGDSFSIDDGFVDFKVINTSPDSFTAQVQEDAIIKNNKGLNLVGIDVDLPSLTQEDKQRLDILKSIYVDFIALSFVRSAADVNSLRHELTQRGINTKIIAKIESQKGVTNIDEIIDVADGIMVARGDLGIEVPLERVTHLQKSIISKCRNQSKPVIVATQMLQSMIDNSRPTRAEAADIANAIYDETDCLMLSGETASGKYPLKSVEYMSKIAHYNEDHKVSSHPQISNQDQTSMIASATSNLLDQTGKNKIDKILVFTHSGRTARIFSSFRPNVPVIAICDKQEICSQLSISFGVTGVCMDVVEEDLLFPSNILSQLVALGALKPGDNLLLVHGHKYAVSGNTNALVLLTV